MAINYAKRGLRLGYLIRGKYHDEQGQSQTLRLCGPSSRVGTGLAVADPDGGAQAPRRYWRAGSAAPTMIEDLGKLDQHIATLNKLSLTVFTDYPERADSEIADTSVDGTLRGHAVSGRWTNRPVDVWFIDLDTEDTDPRLRATWGRDATAVQPGSFSLAGKELPGILGEPWKMGRVPSSTDGWTQPDFANSTNAAGFWVSPNTWVGGGSGGRGFQLGPAQKRLWLGSVFGYDSAAGASSTAPAPVWRRLVYYGGTGGWGINTGVGTDAYPVFWFWVSPQFGCRVGVMRAVDDDGEIHETLGGVIGALRTGHNHDPTRGPTGTFVVAQFDLTGGEAFTFTDNSNPVYARVYGPTVAGPSSMEWDVTWGEPFTMAAGASSPVVETVWDVLELVVDDPEYLDAGILGTTAIADFAAANPSSVADFAKVLAAVPVQLTEEPITYRETLTGLVAGLPADLVWRIDPTVGERRLYPLWRGPRPNEPADFIIRAADLASLSPRPSIRQESDPAGEYSNETTVNGPDFIDQPSSVPFPANDAGLLERTDRFGRQITDMVEQGPQAFNGRRARERKWQFWSPKTSDAGDESARYLAAEVDQPQTWTEAELGGEWMKLQLGDLIQYQIHGITRLVGQVRKLEYALEAQVVTVSAAHVLHYEPDAQQGD